MSRFVLLAISLFGWQVGIAQDLLITNARIIDGLGQTIDDGRVAVIDGQIASVGEPAAVPEDTVVIDAAGMTVMPGMINTHWHLLAGSAATTDAELDKFTEAAVRVTLENILERGVTTIMSTGDHFPAILEVRRKLAVGDLRGPRLLAVGPVFTSPNDWPTQICSGNTDCNEMLTAQVATEEEVRARVSELADAGVDALKFVYDDIIAPDVRIDDVVVAAMADEARKHDLPVLAHVSAPGVPATTLIELGVDGFVHSTMDLSGALPVMRDRQIPVITTAAVALSLGDRGRVADMEFEPDDGGYMNEALQNIQTLWRYGVPVAFGTDSVAGGPGLDGSFIPGTSSGEGLFLAEVRALDRVLTNEAIITSLTRNAALLLGLDDQIGTLEDGKIADIVIIDGDPLDDIADLERVRVVIQGGRVVVDRR